MAIVPLHTVFNLPRFFDLDDDFVGSIDRLMPRINMEDKGTDIEVSAEVPGYTQKDIKVLVKDGKLIISGKKELIGEKKDDRKKYYYKEINVSEFHRIIPLPTKIEKDKVTAKITNGILAITLPKIEKSEEKEIEVKAE